MGAGHQLLEQEQYEKASGVLNEGLRGADIGQRRSLLYLIGQAQTGLANWLDAVKAYSELIETGPDEDLLVASR